jgi:enoyl-CoA hydratase/carnithine racemase
MTARWVGAAEGLALGLVNRIDNDPDQAAGELAATLAALGPGAPQKIKTVASAGALVGRLHAEQQVNRAAWDQMIAAGAD